MISISGCFADLPADGALACRDTAPRCPEGFRCADDHSCWRLGRGPDLSAAGGEDLGAADLFGFDAAVEPDLAGADLKGADAACAPKTLTAATPAIDLIIALDTSGSMTDEMASVKAALNTQLAPALSGLDRRVVLLADFQPATALAICIQPPLGGNACTNEAKAVQTASFYHYDIYVDSTDSFQKILDSYNAPDTACLGPSPSPTPTPCVTAGWHEKLRPQVDKAFLMITDDRPTTHTAVLFEGLLLAKLPAHFGSAGALRYTWYSLTGIDPKSPNGPWLASELPVSTAESDHCQSGVNAGIEYQKLSALSDGLAFSICSQSDYGNYFAFMAQHMLARVDAGCWFTAPAAGVPAAIDLALASGTRRLAQVAGKETCSGDGFFAVEGRIRLCPTSCTALRGDASAKVTEICN